MLEEMIWSCYSARLLKRATVATLKKICKNLNFGEVVVGADDFFFLWVCSPKMGLKHLLEMLYYSGFMAVLR